jgi:hypothetical protein
MSFIKGGWTKIGTILGWIVFYLTYLAVDVTIILLVCWVVITFSTGGPGVISGVPIYTIIFWVWVVWLVIVLLLLLLTLIVLAVDTLVNFFTTWWRTGLGAAWKGLWTDLKNAGWRWFKGCSEELNEQGTKLIERVEKAAKKVKDTIVDWWDWGVDWVKKKLTKN